MFSLIASTVSVACIRPNVMSGIEFLCSFGVNLGDVTSFAHIPKVSRSLQGRTPDHPVALEILQHLFLTHKGGESAVCCLLDAWPARCAGT